MANKKKKTFDWEEIKKHGEKVVLVLPVLSALAYLASYFFEAAFLSVYGLPRQIVQVKTENFILLFLASSVYAILAYHIYDSHRNGEIDLRRFYKRADLLSLFLLLALLIFVALPAYLTGPWLIAAALLLIMRLVAPNFFKRNFRAGKGLKEQSSPQLFILIAAVWVLCALSYFSGRLLGFTQSNYVTYELNNSKFVVIQSYSNTWVLGRINDKLEIQDYQLNSTDSLAGKPFKVEEIKVNKFKFTTWIKEAFQ